MSRLRDLMDAKRENRYKIKKLATGIRQLDSELHGGIPFGAMTTIASYEGSGKSTFVSQIICNAMEDISNKVFMYSGEMSDSFLLNTFTYQMAGAHTTSDCFGRPIVPDGVVDLITSKYRGRIFPYSVSANATDKFELFMSDMLYAHKKLGCNIFIIDNLMSAGDDLVGTSVGENDRQAKVAGRLAEFAADNNVCVILVAHTRKETNYQVQNVNDTISGSSVTKKRSSLILFYNNLKANEKGSGTENVRKILITKNRLYGKKNLDGIKVYYDENCMRIYGDLDQESYLKDFSCFDVDIDEILRDEFLEEIVEELRCTAAHDD